MLIGISIIIMCLAFLTTVREPAISRQTDSSVEWTPPSPPSTAAGAADDEPIPVGENNR